MNNRIELRHLHYFLTVADELHFRKAAERLFISQPGLSTQIKQMEAILGTALFIRDKKTVRLTQAGYFLKDEATFLMQHLERTKRQVQLIGEGHLGEIRIGFLGSGMQTVIPKLLVRLKNRFPQIQTSLEELSNHSQISAVLSDDLDLGFVRLGQVPQGLELVPVFEDTFSLVLPKEHELNASNFQTIGQVAHEDFILFSQNYSPQYFDTVMSICNDAGFTPKVSHKSVHAQTIFRLVENQLGIAIVPTTLQRGFQMNVKFIKLKAIPQRAFLSAVWKKNHRNPVLEHCIDLLLKV